MPYVTDEEALNQPFLDVDALIGELGPPPTRTCLIGTPGLRVVLLHWPPGYATMPHLHPAAEEIFQVVRGRALFSIGDAPERDVGPGELVLARRGVWHAIRVAQGAPLVLLAAVGPNDDRPDEEIELAQSETLVPHVRAPADSSRGP